MSDSAGASAAAPTSSPSAQSQPNSAPTLDEARVNLAAQAEKDEKAQERKARAESSADAGEQEQAPKKAAKPKPEVSEPSDDDIVEAFGEKLTRKEYRELREASKRRQEFDRAAHAKMREAAEQRKAIEAEKAEITRLANHLKENPWALHEKLGLNPEELAEQRLIKSMQKAQMTPEQIEMAEMKAKLAKYEGEREQSEKTAKETRQLELKKQHIQRYDQQIGEALKTANLAKTRGTAAKVARVMADYLQDGINIDPVQAAEIVRGDYHTEIGHELTELVKTNPQQAVGLLPKELVAFIKQEAVKKAADFIPQAQAKREQSIPQPPKPKVPPTLEEARRQMGIRTY